MKSRTLVAAAVVALVVLAGAGGPATAATDTGAAQDGMVTIELVVSTPDGTGIGGAEAEISWDGGSTTQQTRSNGHVLVDVPADATLEISLTHDQYVKNEPHVVEGIEAEQTVETTMYPAATAEVEVVDADGPVEGATVRVRKHGQSQVADRGETGSEGVFTSGEVEEGTYDVTVTKPGYFRAVQTVELAGDSNTTVEISQGDVTVDLLTQDPTDGGPGTVSANATIRLDGDRVVSATTNDRGRRSVVLDVNRHYDVEVSKPGYLTQQTSLRTGESDSQAVFNITREPSISLTAGNEQVVVGENLRVEVTDQYDRPVEGATVFVGGEEAGQTEADGVARVEIPSEGDLEVRAEHEGYESDPATVTGVDPSSGDDTGDTTDETGDDSTGNETDESDGDDGGTGSGSPGFGLAAALLGALAALAVLRRRA